MKNKINPFNPTFSTVPKVYIGRSGIIQEIAALPNNLEVPVRTTLVSGVRGSGKTTMLQEISQLMVQVPKHKVYVVNALANKEMLPTISERLERYIRSEQIEKNVNLKLGIAEFSATVKPIEYQSFVNKIEDLLDQLNAKKDTVLFIIDELQANSEELRIFANSYQMWMQEGYRVAWIGAGLPQNVDSMITDKLSTFLRRANHVELSTLNLAEVRNRYISEFEKTGKSINYEQAIQMTSITNGYPYLVQLMGYYVWNYSDDVVQDADIQKAASEAEMKMYTNVYDAIWQEISENDQDFLKAMIVDDKETTIAELKVRMNKESSWLSVYRDRLIKQGLIKAAGRGKITFVMPFLKNYITDLLEFE